MSRKAERTTKYIVNTVAPIFVKNGFVGTSMSQLTEATGLTKGALYGNFENKEALALAACDHLSEKLIQGLQDSLETSESITSKISAVLQFYKGYETFVSSMGGCPIVKLGVDATETTPGISLKIQETLRALEKMVGTVLEHGASLGEIRLPVAGQQFAKQMLTIIYGGVSMTTITGDSKYLKNTMTYLEYLVKNELNIN